MIMFDGLSVNGRHTPLPNDIKTELIANKAYFDILLTQNKMLVLYEDSIFFTFDVPFTCAEFCEIGSYAGFVQNKVVCNDNRASRLEILFNHLVWKYYVHSVNRLHGRQVVSNDNLSLGYIGLTYNIQMDSLNAHDICSYEMELYQPYYNSLHKLSRRFCRRHKYDGLFFSAPFVY